MTKKREKIERRRTLARTRKGVSAPQRAARPVPPPRKPEEKQSMTDIWLAVGIVALVIIALVAIYYFAVRRPAQRSNIVLETPQALQPTAAVASRDYEAILHTDKGDIRMELYGSKVPNTVENFVKLARQGFYDGVTFHRVIPGFMAQTGDPTGTGTGGPGYTFADEFDPTLRHSGEGIVSMANAGPNTNGSQFFITYAAASHLDDKHSVFGRVIEGMDVVRALTPRDPGASPVPPPGDMIQSVDIIEK
jgi:peptidylprolyl isomerase/peptidyl-prolyl cis-trans isomerase B (cyclophilin B)